MSGNKFQRRAASVKM